MKINLQKIVEHYNYKWPNDAIDQLYYWYDGMYSSKPPAKMPYCRSYSKHDFESFAKYLLKKD